jgi:osmoprotectant transport system ATP-binding protein
VNTDHTAQAEGLSSLRETGSDQSPGGGPATLELQRVSKIYPGQSEPAIAELSFKVEAGEVCVLVGPSGSGKTTAMRLINRMIPLS